MNKKKSLPVTPALEVKLYGVALFQFECFCHKSTGLLLGFDSERFSDWSSRNRTAVPELPPYLSIKNLSSDLMNVPLKRCSESLWASNFTQAVKGAEKDAGFCLPAALNGFRGESEGASCTSRHVLMHRGGVFFS